MERLIFHVDVNSAYLSWESARRIREGGEDLRHIPSAVGGDREKRTGVILAKSIPAKRMGVRTGEPVGMALRKCPDLVLVRPDFKLYVSCSRAFIEVCRKYAPVAEQASIDECFLDMSGTGRIYPDPIAVAHAIKDEIRDTLGFTVNIGIGRNKLLAKMASDFEKPDRVHTLFPEEIGEKLWPLPVGSLFTVGKKTAERLTRARIVTIGDLARADLGQIQALVGMKLGRHIHAFANGVDETPVLAEPETAKGYSISTTLAEDVTDSAAAHSILLALADSVAARMRAEGMRAGCIGVTVRDNDFRNRSHQKRLPETTDITDEIYAVVKTLFDELWDRRTPLRLLGVSLTQVTREGSEQQSLFPDERKEKSRKLDRAVDDIRSRFGADAVIRAGAYQGDVGKKHKAETSMHNS